MKKRAFIAGLSSISSLAIAGCASNNGSESTSTESEYDSEDYFGLPECDGSRPIQLIAVNSDGTGIIQNMRGQDQLVYVKHDDGLTSGDYCGGTIVEGGEQTAYEVTYGGEPNSIQIGAIEATSRNKDEACSQTGALPDGDYDDGCVDPNTFRGYQDVSSDVENEDNSGPVTEVTGFRSALITEGDRKPTGEDGVVSEDDPVYVYVAVRISDSRTVGEEGNKEESATFSIQSATGTYEKTKEEYTRAGRTTILEHLFAIDDWNHSEAEELYSESEIVVEYKGETTTAEDVTEELDTGDS